MGPTHKDRSMDGVPTSFFQPGTKFAIHTLLLFFFHLFFLFPSILLLLFQMDGAKNRILGGINSWPLGSHGPRSLLPVIFRFHFL
jgi:hypothetical protein